jgi:TRAP-type C4-dicarboxylate transport system permease small subunit
MIGRAYDALVRSLVWFAGVCVVAMFVIVAFDVTMRSLGFRPPAGSVAVAEYLLIYATLAVAPYLVRLRRHVFVEMLVAQMSPGIRHVFGRLVALAAAGASFVAAYYGGTLLHEALLSGEMDIRGIDMPQWLQYLPLPVGFALCGIEFARFAVTRHPLYADGPDLPAGH